jgi:PIN domain nuclease of toxin-antitoxin system
MRSVLLDTHVFLWLQADRARVKPSVMTLLDDAETGVLLSAASAWEIAVKFALGRLPLPEPPATYVPDRMQRSAIEPAPIEVAHAVRVSTLPPHHRDPFDRMLVAQASVLGVPLVTADAKLAPYEIELIWA